MKSDLGNFPWRTTVQETCNWKEAFEKEAREILTNLKAENSRLEKEKSEELKKDFVKSVSAYEELITFNKGRIFSLKQSLGDLPKSTSDNSKGAPQA